MFEKLKVFVVENKEVIIKKTVIVTGAIIGIVIATVIMNANGAVETIEAEASDIAEAVAE